MNKPNIIQQQLNREEQQRKTAFKKWQNDLKNKYTQINGILRNDPTGVIYLQTDYIDVFEISTKVELDENPSSVDLENDSKMISH